jgi:glutathione S-transferase
MMRMFDLAAADPAIRFSPYCWRVKLALAHKGLTIESIPWRFTEGDKLPPGCRTVPALVDGETAIGDSLAIARYLERHYPDRPSLFGGAVGEAHALLINSWADAVVGPALVPLLVFDVWAAVAPEDQEYFRRSREQRLGRSLEALHAERDGKVAGFRSALNPARITLRQQPWLGGSAPSYADFILAGPFMWARSISRFEVLAEDDPVGAWRERVLDLFGGLCRNAPRVEVG